ncbi:UNVERIFIED_CONTAM: hypothetical protein Slati_4158600 [Sesamum latifolium]|uniref:Uncharacterized protein n=1 Tax=Sesamum latifolium TaxID=2727402 RepID=A0AAW2TAI3_9LAMI
MPATSIHITALDGIVNVNSLFTLAVFIGLAWNPTDPSNSLIDPIQQPGCSPGPKVAEDLVAFHVYSFSCFLFSSLVALGLKTGPGYPGGLPLHQPGPLGVRPRPREQDGASGRVRGVGGGVGLRVGVPDAGVGECGADQAGDAGCGETGTGTGRWCLCSFWCLLAFSSMFALCSMLLPVRNCVVIFLKMS